MSPEQRDLRRARMLGNMRAVGHKVTPAQLANLKRGKRRGGSTTK